jgi:indoleamine 2,3-dioxygenase
VSKYHDLPPTATYASLVLWNYTFQSPLCDLTDPANLRALLTITGTRDEEWFFVISIALESRGGPIVSELLNCIEAARQRDDAAVIASLARTTTHIQKIGRLLERMYERCDPQIYYHTIRPLLAGTKNMAGSGLPNGVFFDEGNSRGEWRQSSGGSNGQSSLIQLLDIALGVDHYATDDRRGRSIDAGAKSKANGYIKVSCPFELDVGIVLTVLEQDMRNYMPAAHRDFLRFVEKTTNIREYSLSPTASDTVRAAYSEAVTALSKFRDIHLQIVARYVIAPSRSPPAAYVQKREGLNLATASSSAGQAAEKGCAEEVVADREKPLLYGTGGTDLVVFLKQTRDETRAAAAGR